MPIRDLRCKNEKCGKVREDVYFSSIEEIEFECECGSREYILLPPHVNIPKSGTYSFNEKEKK